MSDQLCAEVAHRDSAFPDLHPNESLLPNCPLLNECCHLPEAEDGTMWQTWMGPQNHCGEEDVSICRMVDDLFHRISECRDGQLDLVMLIQTPLEILWLASFQ